MDAQLISQAVELGPKLLQGLDIGQKDIARTLQEYRLDVPVSAKLQEQLKRALDQVDLEVLVQIVLWEIKLKVSNLPEPEAELLRSAYEGGMLPPFESSNSFPLWWLFLDTGNGQKTVKWSRLARLFFSFETEAQEITPDDVTRHRYRKMFPELSRKGSEHAGKARELKQKAPSVGDKQWDRMFDSIFHIIVGYDEVKTLLKAALKSTKPVHVLLVGPPAGGKSLFLGEIESAYGDRAMWAVGSATSQPGLWDLLAERRPRVLLIDELDKLKGNDQAALLTLMEGGRLVRTKVRRALDVSLDCHIVAAANRVNKLSPELLSRFAKRELRAYTPEEFKLVVTGVLVKHEGVPLDKAEEIGRQLADTTTDVRDAVRVARLLQQVGTVESAIKLLNLHATSR